jgi:protein-disulfide isomerase
MRISGFCVVLTAALFISAVGCSNQVTGTAVQDPAQPPLVVSEDGAGIVAGYPDAPVQIEIFTEPQCDHCAELQHAYGDEIASYINLGQLAVTYRFVTFLDDEPDEEYSFGVVSALFLAAEPSTATDAASGPEFQRFVEELWASQDPGGFGPTAEEMAEMATKAGLPSEVTQRIGDVNVMPEADIDEVADENFDLLVEASPSTRGTPTVYDLNKEEKVDLYDSDWLDKLMSAA